MSARCKWDLVGPLCDRDDQIVVSDAGIAEAEHGSRFVLEYEPDGSPWRYAGLVPLGQALFLQGRHEGARAALLASSWRPWRNSAWPSGTGPA